MAKGNFNHPREGKSFGESAKDKARGKSFGELGEAVKEKFFKENFGDLLNMSKVSNLDTVLNQIEKFVEQEGKTLSTSQLRNIYDKAIKVDTVNELKLLRPNLAYLAGRRLFRIRGFW